MLTELMNFAESHLLSLSETWIKTDFIKVHFHAQQFMECKNLQEFCIQKMGKNPELIFKSNDFINISGDILIKLLERDDLDMEEVELWKYVVKWGIYKCSNNLIEKNVGEWEEEYFNELWENLKDLVKLIRFDNISREDFSNVVRPYSSMFPREKYESFLWDYIIPLKQSNKPSRGRKNSFGIGKTTQTSGGFSFGGF